MTNKKEMKVERVPVEGMEDKYPNLYAELKKKGVLSMISVISGKACCLVYEYEAGYVMTTGHYYLYKKWLKEQNKGGLR